MPSEEDVHEPRFARLDQLITRDIERRRRYRSIYYVLLVVAAVLAILALKYGRSAEGVAADTATKTAEDFVKSDQMTTALRGNRSLREYVDEVAAEGVRERFSAFDAKLESLRVDLTRTEKAQTELARSVERQRTGTDKLNAQLAEVSSQLDEIDTQLEETRKELEALAVRRQHSWLTPRSFLLKEDQDNPLPGLDLTIRLGPRDRDGVEAVKVWKGSVPVYPTGDDFASGAVLRFGEVFKFDDRQGNRYVATLTNAQQRFLARDFVGLDVVVRSTGQPIQKSGPQEGSP